MEPSIFDLEAEKKRLRQAAGTALVVEVFFFLAIGVGHLSFSILGDRSSTIDVQVLQLPSNDHLTGAVAVQPDDEVVFDPRLRTKKMVKKETPKNPEQNQVSAEPDLGPTHGPVALFAPSPVIPAHLRDQNLKTSVVIEFVITAQGQVTAQLLESSGNDELDAIALKTVAQWRFKPAAKDNLPIDSKTRLRINFEVS